MYIPPPPKPEVILTNFFVEPTVLLVPITSRAKAMGCIFYDGSKSGQYKYGGVRKIGGWGWGGEVVTVSNSTEKS